MTAVTILSIAALWVGYAWFERWIDQINQHGMEHEMALTWAPARRLSRRLAEDFLIERTPDEIFAVLFEMQGSICGARIYAQACLDGTAPMLPIIQASAPINRIEESNAD